VSTRQEKLKQITNASIIMHREMIDRQMLQSCINCESWDSKIETCLHFKMKPPAKVIVFSCGEQWLGEIPF
jgi:hypothetical protein